ncbi:hypothetical protein Hdeb2414_s0010g00338601 [Helianthus debilis subsp. tardiflorus]
MLTKTTNKQAFNLTYKAPVSLSQMLALLPRWTDRRPPPLSGGGAAVTCRGGERERRERERGEERERERR